MDHSLMPIQDLILPLPYVVQAGCVYELAYRGTENKTVQLRAHFKPEDGDEFVANGELQIEQDARELVTAPLPLATINGELK